MLVITVPPQEYLDETTNTFKTTEAATLQLEHSLLSISKWESKWHKPFLSNDPKTETELIDYIRCMTINSGVKPEVYYMLPSDSLIKIRDYIDDSMTATWFNRKEKSRTSRKIITSEVIYSWMITLGIPFECQKWHLNRLMTLIEVCSIQNEGPKKMSRREAMEQQRYLNAARRAKSKKR